MVRLVLCCVVLLVACRSAYAVSLTEPGCRSYAAWAADTVWAKHVGADKDKVKSYYAGREEPHFKILLRRFDDLWQLPIELRKDVYQTLYMECLQRRGNYGDET